MVCFWNNCCQTLQWTSGECLLAVYTLITLLHGYPYFCFEFFVLAEILPNTCTIWLCGRERETGCFICVCDCECQFLCLVMRYPLIVYVSDSGFQSWSLCLTVCSSVGLCVWLCVPVFVFVTVCLFQSWSMCLAVFQSRFDYMDVCSSFGQCVWLCSYLGLCVRLCSSVCLYLWLAVCSSPGLFV